MTWSVFEDRKSSVQVYLSRSMKHNWRLCCSLTLFRSRPGPAELVSAASRQSRPPPPPEAVVRFKSIPSRAQMLVWKAAGALSSVFLFFNMHTLFTHFQLKLKKQDELILSVHGCRLAPAHTSCFLRSPKSPAALRPHAFIRGFRSRSAVTRTQKKRGH